MWYVALALSTSPTDTLSRLVNWTASRWPAGGSRVAAMAMATGTPRAERTRGLQTGELFVRVNGAQLCAPCGTLEGARPFLQRLVHLQEDDKSAVERLLAPSTTKLVFSRRLRRQLRERRRANKMRWAAVRAAVNSQTPDDVDAVASHVSPSAKAATSALERYLQLFGRLEQAYNQYTMSGVLRLYALLEAESEYISAWAQREEATCRDQRALTKLLYQFNLFALQLNSETSGQVRMWRLPVSDAQRMRCVKAATENVKKRFFSSSGGATLQVLEVYKVDNRVLLQAFQRFTASSTRAGADVKIKGLFCSVPPESIERCVVYGMHAPNSDGHSEEADDEPQFLDPEGAEVRIFNRPTLLQDREDAPGTHKAFRARAKVQQGRPLHFPRRFSRYSTLEETRPSATSTSSESADQPPRTQYLALCRVAMGTIVRVKSGEESSFPDDPSVSTLHFTDEEEYLVRYPDAVVPEFLVQFRVVAASPSALPVPRPELIIPVSLMTSTTNLISSDFQEFIYSSALNSSNTPVAAFPLELQTTNDKQVQSHSSSNFGSKGSAVDASLYSSHAQGQEVALLAKKQGDLDNVPAETVLGNCARQKAQLREDLQRLECLFWRRASELWEQESSDEVSPWKGSNQLHSARESIQGRSSTMIRSLHSELRLVQQLEDEFTHMEMESADAKAVYKARMQNTRHPVSTEGSRD